jgi:hypothetical protein
LLDKCLNNVAVTDWLQRRPIIHLLSWTKSHLLVAGYEHVTSVLDGEPPLIAYCFYDSSLDSQDWYRQTKTVTRKSDRVLITDRLINFFKMCMQDPKQLVFKDKV